MFKYYILHLQTYSLTLYFLSSHIGGVMARVLVLSDVDRKLRKTTISVTNNYYERTLLFIWLIIWFLTRVTWRVALVEQELLTLTEHLTSIPLRSKFRVAHSLVSSVVICNVSVVKCRLFALLVMVLFYLRFTVSDYHFGILKLPLNVQKMDLSDYAITKFVVARLD
jgi:hypothetical protein